MSKPKTIKLRNLKAYKQAAEDLLFDTLGLAGLIATLLPRDVRPDSAFARLGGSQWRNHDLMTIAKKLEDVTFRFDAMQFCLGLPDHDARFGHPAPDSTQITINLNPETQNMGVPKTKPPASKPKSASKPPKQAPKPKSGAGKPPIHGGGAGHRSDSNRS
jgi:hypothetical protein